MFSFFQKRKKEKDDIELFRKELSERETELDDVPTESEAERVHFDTMTQWKELKKKVAQDESLYPNYIKLLKVDCDVHDQFVKEYYKRWQDTVSYPAFKELALAYERTGEIQKAIDISKEAIEKAVVEHVSFENRIKRLEKKLST